MSKVKRLEEKVEEIEERLEEIGGIVVRDCPKCKHLTAQSPETWYDGCYNDGFRCLNCGSLIHCRREMVCEIVKENKDV